MVDDVVPQGMRPCVLIWDSRTVWLEKPQNFNESKRKYSSKTSTTCLTRMVACDATGMPVAEFPLAPSSSPTCTDESISQFLLDLEAQQGIAGGVSALIQGVMPYYTIHLFDKGFRYCHTLTLLCASLKSSSWKFEVYSQEMASYAGRSAPWGCP